MKHIELAGGVGANFHRHPNAVAAVVAWPGRDQRQVTSPLAEVLREHFLIAFEAPARNDHRAGAQPPQQAVTSTDHDTIDPSLLGLAQADCLGLIEDLDPAVRSTMPASPWTIAAPPPTGIPRPPPVLRFGSPC